MYLSDLVWGGDPFYKVEVVAGGVVCNARGELSERDRLRIAPQTNLDSWTRSEPALELHSRAASSVGRSRGPNTGCNSGERQIIKKSKKPNLLVYFEFQKWLEVSSKRRNGPACCELCQYQYLRHKKFVVSFRIFFIGDDFKTKLQKIIGDAERLFNPPSAPQLVEFFITKLLWFSLNACFLPTQFCCYEFSTFLPPGTGLVNSKMIQEFGEHRFSCKGIQTYVSWKNLATV